MNFHFILNVIHTNLFVITIKCIHIIVCIMFHFSNRPSQHRESQIATP